MGGGGGEGPPLNTGGDEVGGVRGRGDVADGVGGGGAVGGVVQAGLGGARGPGQQVLVAGQHRDVGLVGVQRGLAALVLEQGVEHHAGGRGRGGGLQGQRGA